MPRPAASKTRSWRRKILLACGPVSALVYIGWHEVAALQWEGYNRISNAISELHLTGASSKWMLDPWEGLVYNALLIAIGLAVALWRRPANRDRGGAAEDRTRPYALSAPDPKAVH